MKDSNRDLLYYMSHQPELYEASTSPFWDDENISKYMLAAHLDSGLDAASRKHDFIQKSADWIANICDSTGASKKKLLDLGCGPGIYAEFLTENGFEVTGVDMSRRSIQYAKDHAEKAEKHITYVCQNYLELEYENEFDVVTLIYCDFGVLSPGDREKLLCKIWNALKDGGILILDAIAKKYLEHFQEKQTVHYQKEGFWAAEPYVCIERNSFYQNTGNILNQYLIVKEHACECYNVWNQVYSKESLGSEIEKAGFKMLEFYDDVAGKMFTGEEEALCVVARK